MLSSPTAEDNRYAFVMPELPFLHAPRRSKKRLLLGLAVPGVVLGLFGPWLWVTVVGTVLLLVAVFFASAFVWEREFPSAGQDSTG
jgi:hypothetical protein